MKQKKMHMNGQVLTVLLHIICFQDIMSAIFFVRAG